MKLEILHRAKGKPQRSAKAKEVCADDDVAPATQAKPSVAYADQRPPTKAESHVCERSPCGRIPSVSTVDNTGNEILTVSFDALASHLNAEFARLAADVEKMRQELRDAEKRSGQLKHQMLNGKPLSSLRSAGVA